MKSYSPPHTGLPHQTVEFLVDRVTRANVQGLGVLIVGDEPALVLTNRGAARTRSLLRVTVVPLAKLGENGEV